MTDGPSRPDGLPEYNDLPLRSRLRDYLVVWVIGAAGGALVGAAVDGVAGAGYGLLFLGIGFLLFGGVSGGGYTRRRPGAVAARLGRSEEGAVRRPPRRRRGWTRPEANPTALWSVIGGFAYVAVGFWLIG